MMTYRVKVPLQTAQISDGSSDSSRHGPDPAGFPPHRNFRPNVNLRRKFPTIQPLIRSRDDRSLLGEFIVGGSHNTPKDYRLEPETNNPEQDIYGRHFAFDRKYERLERTRTVIAPMPRDFHMPRPGNLHHFSLPKELSHSHAVQPFTLSYPNRYELSTSPAILFPSTLVLNGRNTFSVDNCKLSRPKLNYPTCNLLTVKDNQKSPSYADPTVGASRSFLHRISELSSLEGDTVRQENLKKMRKPRKPS
ncbi:putative uncharacterized protein C8orf89 homolog [Genypterus blacodes]|uniref:putative uncharacterized protein C8orf89 homolog n=1 Tax=Genypterus blacodes TaxID=154954 RepID=UPI003F761BC8